MTKENESKYCRVKITDEEYDDLVDFYPLLKT